MTRCTLTLFSCALFVLCWSNVVHGLAITGCLLEDVNCNGTYDEGTDIGIAGEELVLFAGDGTTVIATAITSNDVFPGYFVFEDLVPNETYFLLAPDPTTGGLSLNAIECGSPTCEAQADISGNPVRVDFPNYSVTKINFLYCEDDDEPEGVCWMTGGGVKFEPVTRTMNAQCNSSGPKDTMGGVVAPACRLDPSNGQEWNHVAHSAKLHVKGRDAFTIRCGNVPDHPEGSGADSPPCEFNFIEWEGDGWVQGLRGNRPDPDSPRIPVFIEGRVEDRNEPGNDNANKEDGGSFSDRYYLRVTDEDGNLILLVDADGVDAKDSEGNPVRDGITITGGNLQLHCKPCDNQGDGGGASFEAARLTPNTSAYFLRGDSNFDGGVDVSDAVFSLAHLFLDAASPQCFDSADTNDDGMLDLADPIMGLASIYSGGPQIPQPHPGVGRDPTGDPLDCAVFAIE